MNAAILEKSTDVPENTQPLSFMEVHGPVPGESQIYFFVFPSI
jgi:hypothetical protein